MSSQARVAVVTGASRGLGAAIARRLARDGFSVVVNYAVNATAANDVAAAICTDGGQAVAVRADVGNADEVCTLFDRAEAEFGSIDVVINNAGIMKLMPVAELQDAAIDQTIATNLKGTLNACREAARRINEGGRIINLSSSVIGMRLPSYGVYAATKAAVESLTQVLAQEMRGRGVTVNAVAPGPSATELFLEGKSDALIEELAHMNPLERLADPDDIARVVAFLAGPDAGWINGQIIRANGGMC